MKHLAVAVCLLVIMAAGIVPAAGQGRDLSRVRVLAIAPFSDENPLTRHLAEWGAIRLGEMLRGGRIQIIESSRVAAELARMGVTPVELISPSRTVALGAALGADAVLTGRVVQIFQEVNRSRGEPGVGFWVEARAVVDVRVLEVGSRLKLFEEEIACSVSGLAAAAMECVVRGTAARLPRN